MNIGPSDIQERIKDAGDEYVDGNIDEEELEERIERALKLEYSYRELLTSHHFCRLGQVEDTAMIFGEEISPGESICLDDKFSVDPLEQDVCPY